MRTPIRIIYCYYHMKRQIKEPDFQGVLRSDMPMLCHQIPAQSPLPFGNRPIIILNIKEAFV